MKKAPSQARQIVGVPRKNRGFTLFVALIVSSMLLAVGLSLGNIILKQLIFASSGTESQLAFYAADSGAECALYWDRKAPSGDTVSFGSFATSTLGDVAGDGQQDIRCGAGGSEAIARVGGFSKVVTASPQQDSATTTFSIDYSDTATHHVACASVSVSKWLDYSNPLYPVEHTLIDSRGYNAPFVGITGIQAQPVINPDSFGHCDTSGPRVVERAMRLEY